MLACTYFSRVDVDTFKSIVHQGSALKCKHINPSPSNPDVEHYRDISSTVEIDIDL